MNSRKSVLVVDYSDSARDLISKFLESRFPVDVTPVSSARSAVGLFQRKSPESRVYDLLVINSEPPESDIKEILSKIRELSPKTKIILAIPYQSQSEDKISELNALFDEKLRRVLPSEDNSMHEEFRQDLLRKAKKLIGLSNPNSDSTVKEVLGTPTEPETEIILKKLPAAFFPDVIAISSSTGGPRILNQILKQLKGRTIRLPIFITQHMPSDFTGLMAEQISEASEIKCQEASDGMEIENGEIYVAPGNYHMLVKKSSTGKNVISLSVDAPENFCRPAADPMLRSLLNLYGGQKILSVVLTGMGQDGLKGCEMIVEKGGVVLAQDPESSAVWGMPGAVAKAGICTFVLPPEEMAEKIIELSGGKIS